MTPPLRWSEHAESSLSFLAGSQRVLSQHPHSLSLERSHFSVQLTERSRSTAVSMAMNDVTPVARQVSATFSSTRYPLSCLLHPPPSGDRPGVLGLLQNVWICGAGGTPGQQSGSLHSHPFCHLHLALLSRQF